LKFHLSSLLLVDDWLLLGEKDFELALDVEVVDEEPVLVFFSFGFGAGDSEVTSRNGCVDDKAGSVEESPDAFLRISRRDCCAVGLSSTVWVDR
jgi:hypothetical protein